MAMQAYVAGRLKEMDLVQEVQQLLQEQGFSITFDWTRAGAARGDPDAMEWLSEQALRGSAAADLMVVLLANGEASPQRGTHLELGAALISGAKVVIWAPPEHAAILDPSNPRCISFYVHRRVTRLVCPRNELLDRLRALV